jgi:crotonobetainyl-CoA:carnitine CoA-transferase CaiB-like acyl-CoA transferase
VNKLGVTLDLTTPTGRAWLRQLTDAADIFLYVGQAGPIGELGLDHASLSSTNPRLIGVYVTPFGLTGPYRDYVGDELILAHLSGLAHETPGGESDESKPPTKPGGHHHNMVGGIHGAIGAMQALFMREITGVGQEVDVSELEASIPFGFMGVTRYTFGEGVRTRAEARSGPRYRSRDGEIAINPMQTYMWQAFVEVLGNPEWARDPELASQLARASRHREVTAGVEEWTLARTKEEAYQTLQAARVPAFPSNSIADIMAAEQMKVRGVFPEIPFPDGDSGRGPRPRYQMSRGMPGVQRPAPRLGEHNAAILVNRLGLSADTVAAAFEQAAV